jgi:plastocyanin
MGLRPCIVLLGIAAGIFSASLAEAETIRINIAKLTFAPVKVSAHVGDTIEWVNNDFVAHTATSRTKDWDVALPVKAIGHVTLTQPGSIEYYCRFHPNMIGQILVTAD